MIPVSPPADLADDLDLESLNAAIETSIRYYRRTGGRESFCFTDRCYTDEEMIRSLRHFQAIMNGPASVGEKAAGIRESFDFYQTRGLDDEGAVLFTGYFEPVLKGMTKRTEQFRYPLYRTPAETVTVRLGQFHTKYGKERVIGRLVGREVVPHYSRKEIDTDKVLAGRGLEIAWVDDPVALFLLHIQGSGQILLPDGRRLRINYAQTNGKPFRGLTTYMVEKGFLEANEKTYAHMKTYLQNHPESRENIMNYNESYVFFRIVDDGPLGSLGLPVLAHRSIATDADLFPKGALVLIKTRKPVFNKAGRIEHWRPFNRFVLNHDTGGAIKGPGRADLFCGTGDDAERLAGSLAERGVMILLAPKREWSLSPRKH